jgi:hypothetical protein
VRLPCNLGAGRANATGGGEHGEISFVDAGGRFGRGAAATTPARLTLRSRSGVVVSVMRVIGSTHHSASPLSANPSIATLDSLVGGDIAKNTYRIT